MNINLPPPSDKLNVKQRHGMGVYVPRIPQENEAKPRTIITSAVNSFPKMGYSRPGSDAHLACRSLGDI
jgi:hypothetical protein